MIYRSILYRKVNFIQGYAYNANKKNLPRISLEYFYSCKALGSKNEWPLFFIDDLIISDCQRFPAVGCRCSRGTFAFQLSKNV